MCGCSMGLEWLLPPAWGTAGAEWAYQAQPGAAVAFSSRASAEDLVTGAQARSRRTASLGDPRSGPHTRKLACPHTGFHSTEAQPCTLKAGCPLSSSEHDLLCPLLVLKTAGFSVMFILFPEGCSWNTSRTCEECLKNALSVSGMGQHMIQKRTGQL